MFLRSVDFFAHFAKELRHPTTSPTASLKVGFSLTLTSHTEFNRHVIRNESAPQQLLSAEVRFKDGI